MKAQLMVLVLVGQLTPAVAQDCEQAENRSACEAAQVTRNQAAATASARPSASPARPQVDQPTLPENAPRWSSAQLASWASAHIGRYETELKGGPLWVWLPARLNPTLNYSPQDQLVEVVVEKPRPLLGPVDVDRQCRESGTYTGRNAFGVTVKVRQMACQGWRIAWPDRLRDLDLGAASAAVRMTPDQFRQLQASKLQAEVLVRLADQAGSQPIVTQSTERITPTVRNPIEVTMRFVDVLGSVAAARVTTPGGQRLLQWTQWDEVTQHRAQAEAGAAAR